MSEHVLREVVDGLCTLTVNRPDKLNALDTQTFRELDEHLSFIERQDQELSCVVLRGAGRGFCAGADITALANAMQSVPPELKPSVIERLSRIPQPVIAAIHGTCFTGGLELALACDFIVADTTARFADKHAKWGLVAAWGLTQRLPRRVGSAAAKRMTMTSRVIAAEEAHKIGLVDVLCPVEEFSRLLAELVKEIKTNSSFTFVQ
jgi:enoyl-CoA hydratase/carnithine racemase